MAYCLGAPLPTAGAWRRGWGANSDFQQSMGEAVRLKDGLETGAEEAGKTLGVSDKF